MDTDVVSYLLNRHSMAEQYDKLLMGHTPMVSFMTVAELYRVSLRIPLLTHNRRHFDGIDGLRVISAT